MRPVTDVEIDIMRLLRLAAALLLLCAVAAPAQEPPQSPPDPARFLIETITVDTDRKASAGIIESETLLKEGGTYTEDDLRQAIARVHRLPFVLDATFSLRKGSTRGAYELVIQASTARWFFFDRRLQLTRFDQAYALAGRFFSSANYPISQTGLIGARLFVGRSGVLDGSFGLHEDLTGDGFGAQVGYTQYDLFGRGIVAGISYTADTGTEVLPFGIDPNLSAWEWRQGGQASLGLAIPLAPRRSLQLGWTERRGQASDRRRLLDPFGDLTFYYVVDGDQTSRQLDARWVYDTRDDLLFPSRGTVLSAGLEYSRYETDVLHAFQLFRGQPPVEVDLPPFDGEQLAAEIAATRHWSVTPRQSVSAGGRLSIGRSQVKNLQVGDRFLQETDLDVLGGSVSGRHLLRLWSLREPGNSADLYLDTNVTLGIESTSLSLGLRDNPLERLELSTGITFRNQWGRLRFILSYLDLGEVLR
jgi:surface antigen Omp85-like protein